MLFILIFKSFTKFRRTLFLLFLCSYGLFAQSYTPVFLASTSWIPSNDLKKWDKLVEQLTEAEKLFAQSNDCYLQIGNIEADSDIDEKKKVKQIEKLDEQATGLYNQSLLKYKEIYTGFNAIVEKNLNENHKSNPYYTEWNENTAQASAIYNQYTKLQSNEDREQLSRANELQLLAVEKGISVFTFQTDAQPLVSEPIVQEVTETQDIVIDAALYKKYKEYTSNSEIPDPVVVSRIMMLEGDAASFEAFQKMWSDYLLFDEEKEKLKQEMAAAAKADSIAAAELALNQASSQTDSVLLSANNVENKNRPVSSEKDAANLEVLFPKIPPEYSTGNEFRVQIAASRSQLGIAQINSIYKGPLRVIEIKEGNFYRYQIGSFQLYSDAQQICSQTAVDNAYLTAYNSNAPQQLGQAVKDTRGLEAQVKKYGRERVLKELEFAVQISASKIRFTPTKLGELYAGGYPVTTVFEGGWYKYQLLTGSDLQKALDLLESCGIKEAFLVAYKNGRKQTLYKALHEYKTYKQ